MLLIEKSFEIFVWIVAYSFAFLMICLMWAGICFVMVKEFLIKKKNLVISY
jgi:hypothetical protein